MSPQVQPLGVGGGTGLITVGRWGGGREAGRKDGNNEEKYFRLCFMREDGWMVVPNSARKKPKLDLGNKKIR